MNQRNTNEPAPTVTTEWTAADMPGQYQALMAILFGGTAATVEDVAA